MFKTNKGGKLSIKQGQVLDSNGKIKPSHHSLQKIINQSPVVICTFDKEGRFVQVNDSVRDIWGYQPEELIHQEMNNFLHPNYVAVTYENKASAMKGKEIREFQNCVLSAEGQEVFMEWSARWDCEDELIYCVGVDVSELKRAETEKEKVLDKLKKSLEEKEMLLSEIHHRVKNNLAIISGLLQLEAFEEQNADIQARLMEFVTRIHSIANVHEHLYKSNSFSHMDFTESLQVLVKKVIDTVQTETEVVPEFEMDPLQLNINQAMPLSMIVNELLNFILKHSLQGLEKGAIKAELRVKGEAVNLKVTDNGKGLAEIFKAGEEKPLGMQLIDQLSKQLEGDYSCEATDAGSEYNFAFKKADRKGPGNARL